MPGTMSQSELVDDLKASISDAANIFTAANDADFKRHLDLAALDFSRVRPRTLLGSLTLVADQHEYAAPADLVAPKYSTWGRDERRSAKPWESSYPGRLPRLQLVDDAGTLKVWLDPAPTTGQITLLTSTYKYFYLATHSVAAAASDTTIVTADRGLLLLRAQAEVMKELAVRNSGKPVTMRDGMSGVPKNGTPAALHEQLMEQYRELGGIAA